MPFQKPLADIPTQVVSTAPAVDTTTAQAIQAIGAIAGQTVKDVQKGRIRDDIQQSADVVSAIGGALEEKGPSAFNTEGEIQTSGLTPDLQAQIDRVKATAGEKFTRIANAVKQGAMPQTAAALETEATMRRLINQTPGFGSEIRQLARDLVGFDPTGFALRQILNADRPASPKVTAQQKRVEEAQVLQDGLARAGKTITLDTLLGNLALRDNLQLERDVADAELSMNTLSTRQWAQKSFVERGPDLSGTLMKVVEMGREGGIADPTQFVNAVISQQEADKVAFRRQVASSGGMDPAEARAIETQIDAMYAPLINSIKNNKMGEILDNNLELVAKTNKLWGKEATPRLTRLIDAYGPQIGGQLLDMMSSIADPAQFELIYQFDPKLKELILGGQETQLGAAEGVERVANKILQGEPVSPQDLDFRPLAEVMVTQPGNTAAREAYVKGLGASGSPVRAVSILAARVPRAQATADEVGFMKAQFNVHVGTLDTEDIPGNLIDLVAREIMELDPGSVGGALQVKQETDRSLRQMLMGLAPKETGRSKLFIPFDPTKQGSMLDWQTDNMKRLQPFLDAVVVGGYGADLGTNKDLFAGNIVDRINSRVTLLRERESPEVPQKALQADKDAGTDFFTAIFKPSLVTGWALPENRPLVKTKQVVAGEETVVATPVQLEEIPFEDYIEATRMAESNGDQKAVSPVGAIGSMQVMPPTAREPGFGVAPARVRPDGRFDLDDIDRLGEDYLKAMLKRYNGDYETALVAYNAGPGNADKFVKANKDYSVLPDRAQTEPYVKRAFEFLKKRLEGKTL